MRNNKEIVEFENLFLQNQWIDFNQTWHKVFLGEGDQVCTNEWLRSFPRWNNNEITKIHSFEEIKKSSSPEPMC